MDYMDTDQVCDVPDTPDRLDKQNGRHLMEKESDYSVASHSGKSDFFDEGATNWLRGKSKLVIDNGHSRRPSFHPVKKHCTSNKSEFERNVIISLGNSSPSKNAHVFRRMAVDNKANDENRNSLGCQPKEGKGKAIWTSTFRGNDVVDLTEQSGRTQLLQKAFPNGASEHCRTEEIRKVPISANGFSSLHGIANSSTVAQSAYKGKGKMDDTCKGSPGIDRGKGIFGDSVPNAGKSLLSIPSPSVRGPKRLVRYGFISPHSTQKAKQLAENHMNGSTDVQSDNGAPEYDVSSSLIRELIAEDGNSERRKLFSSKEPGTETMNFSTRRSLTSNEEVSGTSNSNAWRSTRNRTKQVNPPLSDRGQHPSKTKNEAHSANQQIESSAAGRDNGSRSSKERGNIHHVDNGNGHFAAASTFIKRQMQSSASSNRGETSTSVDSKIVFLGSSVEPSNSRSINNWSSPGILNPIIEIEELSPERKRGSRRGHTSSNSDSNARGRQLEADEMLARELQEQLYNEAPGGGNGEACNIDAHIALALQQEETSQRAFSGGSHPSHSRGLGISNSSRQPRSRSSQFPSVRRGTQVQGRSSTRMTRLRSRLPSQSTRISHRERRSIPSPDMDLGMRTHLLEALQAFSGMGVAGNFLQDVHDFNEYWLLEEATLDCCGLLEKNDYERLLALDENNHHHGGSSLDQINRLPVSTVQGNNFDETCAICLDTPTTGDTIRHLPCLHKFHKDCIDPWLRRKTSCPVCKCCVT